MLTRGSCSTCFSQRNSRDDLKNNKQLKLDTATFALKYSIRVYCKLLSELWTKTWSQLSIQNKINWSTYKINQNTPQYIQNTICVNCLILISSFKIHHCFIINALQIRDYSEVLYRNISNHDWLWNLIKLIYYNIHLDRIHRAVKDTL